MTVYAKKVTSDRETFKGRTTTIFAGESFDAMDMVSHTPVPDNITLCNGCNDNIDEGYLVYLDKKKLQANKPYDYYCLNCMVRSFPNCTIIGGV